MSLSRAQADLAKARWELQRFESLAEMARQRVIKLEHYLEVVRMYEDNNIETQEENQKTTPVSRGGLSTEIIKNVVDYLKEKETFVPTRELVRVLASRGVRLNVLPGREVTNLSAYLSRAPELTNIRSAGWGLRDWESNREQQTFADHEGQNSRGIESSPSSDDADDL